jgi:hypothetical protein
MEPNSKEKDNFDLPPPRVEGSQPIAEQPSDGVDETATARGLEQGIATTPPMAQAQTSSQQQGVADLQMTGYSGVDDQAGGTTPAGMPQIADDTDLIEKEWVDKAKAIVEQTAHDPYLQNQEINKVKVDYLKKRYNKDIKLSDD